MNFNSFATFCVYGVILCVLLTEMLSSPFYTDQDLSRSREQAVAAAREGNFEAALDRFEGLLSIAPDNQSVLYDYLVVLHWAGQDKKALSLLGKVEPTSALPSYAIRELIDAAITIERFDVANELYNAGIKGGEDLPGQAVFFAQRLIAAQELDRAVDVLATALVWHPGHPSLLVEIGRAYHFQHSPDAYPILDKLLSLDTPTTSVIELWMDNLITQARGGELEEAIYRFESADSRYPYLKPFYGDYAVLLSWAGRVNDVADLSTRISLDSQDTYILKAIAKSLRDMGNNAEAVRLYRMIVGRDSLDIDAQLGLSLALIDEGDTEEALDILLPVTHNNPQHQDALKALAITYENSDMPHQAGEIYRRLYTLVDDTSLLNDWVHNAVVASNLHGLKSVDNQFQDMLSNPVKNQRVLNEYILLLMQEDKTAEARRWEQYLDINQSPDYVVEALAKEARTRGDVGTAERLYKTGIHRFPENLQMRIGLGLTYVDAKQKALSYSLLSRLNEQKPSNQQILEALHYFYLTFDDAARGADVLAQLASIAESNKKYLRRWAEHMVSLAGSDDRGQVIEQFEKMMQRYPDNSDLRYDYLSLLSQDNQHLRLLEKAEFLDFSVVPAYVLEMLGYAARQVSNPELAKEYYQLGVTRFPGNPTFPVALALTLIDQGRYEEALVIMVDVRRQFGEGKDLLFAFAYAYEQLGNNIEAMKYYDKILSDWPNNEVAYRQWVVAINNSGAPHLAIEKAMVKPRLFVRNHWKRFFADRAAVAIRWGQLPSQNPAESNKLTDEAIVLADQFIAFLDDSSPLEKQAILKARMDRIIAYRDRGMSDRVIDEYTALNESTEQLPNFVLNAVADAYLHRERPEEAKALLIAALDAEPNHHGSLISLFYANLESEDYSAAQKTILTAVDQQSIWRTRDNRTYHENGKRFGSERTSTLGVAYANDLAGAQEKLEVFLTEAPNNTDMRSDLGALYRWRGWPEASLLEYQLIEPIEPDLLSMELGIGYTLFDLKEYKQVHERLGTLTTKYVKDKGVQNLSKDWELYNSPEFMSHASWGRSTGSTFGSRDFTVESHLFSSPIDYHYRGYFHHYRATATLEEGDGRFDRVGAGIDVRRRKYDANLELTASTIGNSDPGLTLAATWRFDDFWSVSGDVQTYSNNTPVRAYYNGVDAASTDVSVLYRLNESEHYRANAGLMSFSDGNLRNALGFSHYHTVFQNEHHHFSLTESVGFSSNTKLDGPYFSPSVDGLVGVSAEYKGILDRHYDRYFQHRLRTGIGSYYQETVGTGLAMNVEYEHRWNRSKAFSWYYGASLARRPYDGNVEDNTGLFAGVNWKL